MIKENTKMISLKEAAEISGYSPDYIGQLIRSGKIPGKQVFVNVAWMTTEDAVRTYMQKTNKSDTAERVTFLEKFTSEDGILKLFNWTTKAFIGCMAVFLIFLTYVLFVSIDHRIEQNYAKKLERSQ